jgi:S-layer homology domain
VKPVVPLVTNLEDGAQILAKLITLATIDFLSEYFEYREMRLIIFRVLFVLIVAPGSVSATNVQFRDVSPSAWYASYVDVGVNLGIVSGYKDANGQALGEFRPASFVTLGEALKMAIEAQSYSGFYHARTCPEDCPLASNIQHWAASYVQTAREQKFQIFDQDISLDRPASRRQVAQIVADAARIKTDGSIPKFPPFLDVPTTSKHAIAIDNMKSFGIITGDADAQGRPTGYFRPVDTINRAEALKMVISTGERFSDLPIINSDNTITFKDDTDGEGVFPFTFKYPKDVMVEQNSSEGSNADFELIVLPKTNDRNILAIIRTYVDSNHPIENHERKEPGFKTFVSNGFYVEIFTENGQTNEAWQTIISSFSFLR